MKTSTKNDSAIVRHLEDDGLISYLDGELAHDEQEQSRLHLESCWSCRTRLSATQTSVEDFMRLKQETLLPRKQPPSGPITDLFHHRLSAHINSNGRRPHFNLNIARMRLKSFTRSLVADRFAFMTSPAAIRAFVFLLAAAIIAVVVIRSNRVTTVSANELIQRATDAQAASIRATSQPVVHQRLQLRRKDQTRDETINWETWNDTTNARFFQTCDGCATSSASKTNTQHPTPNTPVLLTELNAVLVANHMDPQRPLSASSYQSWRNTLAQKQEEVTRTKLSSGDDSLRLRTVQDRERKHGL